MRSHEWPETATMTARQQKITVGEMRESGPTFTWNKSSL